MQQKDMAGLAFPVIKVRYNGPTNTRGGGFTGTLRRDGETIARVRKPYDHSTNGPRQAMDVAKATWAKYLPEDDEKRVFIPGEAGNEYVYVVVPADLLTEQVTGDWPTKEHSGELPSHTVTRYER